MKQTYRLLALLLMGLILLTGCSGSGKTPETTVAPTSAEVTTAPAETTEPVQTTQQVKVDTLDSLRQSMAETSQMFAVSYFGYHQTIDSPLPVDPFEVMQEITPQLCEEYPFLLEISEDRIIGEGGELFCIVPLDENATVAVSRGYWDDENQQYIYDDMLYSSATGEPILLFCNNFGWEPDTQVYISGPSGDVFWYPQVDDNGCAMPLRNDNWENLFRDFSPYREMLIADYSWILQNIDWEAVQPTEEMLVGNTWMWSQYLKDGREAYYSVTFAEDTLTVHWNDGIDTIDHEYADAPWELTYEEGYAVLSIDFQEFAGVLRYNLLYSQFYDYLYVAMDVLQDQMPIGWEPLSRTLTPPLTPDTTDMAGLWEMVWTEVEGYQEEVEPATYFLEITTDYEGLFWISYINNEFTDWSFYDKELVIFPFAMYEGCENSQWIGAVNYSGKNGTEYDVTLLPSGKLLMKELWTVDGAPMVGYRWFKRVE